MALFIIASLVENKGSKEEIVGYKVLDSNNGEYTLLSERSILQRCLNIENAEFVEMKLKGTQGDLSRYTKINVEDGKAHYGQSAVILGKTNEGYYVVVPYPEMDENLIRLMSLFELKKLAKVGLPDMSNNVRIANARIDNLDSRRLYDMRIRPIKGTFKIIRETFKYIEKVFDFKNLDGTDAKWRVRLVRNGEQYGNEYCLVYHGKSPLVEFYDMTQDEEKFPIGQFVSSYTLDTLKYTTPMGLKLNMEVPKWSLNQKQFAKVQEWLNFLDGEGITAKVFVD